MSNRVLVVEDQPDNRQIIRDMLGGIDCEITEAEDGVKRTFSRSVAMSANDPKRTLIGVPRSPKLPT